jgi:tRNA/rRNA methyltransferase
VLSHPSHPGNIGAAARALKTMGLTKLFLINPQRYPDRQAGWMASNAGDILERAVVCESLEKALVGTTLVVALTARVRDLSHRAMALREAAPQLIEEALSGEVAIVFGNEMSGLSNAELDKCQLLVTIPANPGYTSLNLAAAVQVVAYELRTAALGHVIPAAAPFPMATHEELEYFYRHLEDVLCGSGFLDPEEPRRLMRRLRRLFSRARLEKQEIDILRGVLKSMHNRVE